MRKREGAPSRGWPGLPLLDNELTVPFTFFNSSFIPSSALPPNCIVGAAARTTVRWAPSEGANPIAEVAKRATRTEITRNIPEDESDRTGSKLRSGSGGFPI